MTSEASPQWCSRFLGRSKISTFNATLPGDKHVGDKHGRICFCRSCGSVIYRESEIEGMRGLVFILVGTLDDIEAVKGLHEEEWY
jgi:hypothetical protein